MASFHAQFGYRLVFVLSLIFTTLAINPGQLGVQLNGQLNAESPKLWVWMSIAEFKNDVSSFKDSDIVGFAKQAYEDMQADFQKPGEDALGKKKRPAVVTVIATGRKLYISSSIKGMEGWAYTPSGNNPVIRAALDACRAQNKQRENGVDADHRVFAGCGEIMASQLAVVDKATLEQARIVTWGFLAKDQPVGVKDPCGNPPTDWGCMDVCGYFHYRVIPSNTVATNPTIEDPRHQPPCV